MLAIIYYIFAGACFLGAALALWQMAFDQGHDPKKPL